MVTPIPHLNLLNFPKNQHFIFFQNQICQCLNIKIWMEKLQQQFYGRSPFFFSKIWKRFFKKKKRKKEREENGRCLTCDKSGIFKIVHEQMCIYIYQPLSTRSRVCSEALLFFGYRLIQSIYYNLGLLHFSNHKKKPRGAMKIYFNAHNTHHTPRFFL